jgi:hypothetical protein
VRRIPVFFAEARVMRPSVGLQAKSESPSGYAVIPRQEVSERIGLGRSSCARMPSGGPLREVSIAEAIGPWPVKPRLALAAHSPMATLGVARSLVMLMRERRLPTRGRVRSASFDHETEVSIHEGASGALTEKKPGSGRKPGVGWRLRSSHAKAREASNARKRVLGMLGDVGIGRFAGGARGLFVLQKSTSGVGSSARP